MNTYYVVTSPGTQTFTTQELEALGLKVTPPLPEKVKVHEPTDLETSKPLEPLILEYPTFQGDLRDLYLANLHSRTASRFLVRLGMSFMAREFSDLLEKASRLPWEKYLQPGQSIALNVESFRSKLYHTEAVAERILLAIETRLKKSSPRQGLDEVNEFGQQPQLVEVKIHHNKCSVYLDSSGNPLHKRGYRLETAKAPLRETLAAACLLASGWDGKSPL